MDMMGDLVSNKEFFRDSWQSYATTTKLANEDKIVAATLSIMGEDSKGLKLTCNSSSNEDSQLLAATQAKQPIQSGSGVMRDGRVF